MVFTTGRFFEVAIESWPDWDSNPQRSNVIQLSQLSYQVMSSTRFQS